MSVGAFLVANYKQLAQSEQGNSGNSFLVGALSRAYTQTLWRSNRIRRIQIRPKRSQCSVEISLKEVASPREFFLLLIFDSLASLPLNGLLGAVVIRRKNRRTKKNSFGLSAHNSTGRSDESAFNLSVSSKFEVQTTL